jgi:hypothetical protein
MAVNILSPKFSFIEFDRNTPVVSNNFEVQGMCLPYVDNNDIAFQFLTYTSTKAETDFICASNPAFRMGLVFNPGDLATFYDMPVGNQPSRYRLDDTTILWLWPHGFPGVAHGDFGAYGKCFYIRVEIATDLGWTAFHSNCFQYIQSDAFTAVVEYGGDENQFGFNYCFDDDVLVPGSPAICVPTFLPFNNLSTLIIPVTAQMTDMYGSLPSAQVWIYDVTGELVETYIRAAYDAYPPTQLRFDFGGPASGVIKIS